MQYKTLRVVSKQTNTNSVFILWLLACLGQTMLPYIGGNCKTLKPIYQPLSHLCFIIQYVLLVKIVSMFYAV